MLKFIGTGSAFNTRLGNNSAYIKQDGVLFLIDCGAVNFDRMKESGLLDDVEKIHVYVTHTHSDHIGSLADLIFYMYYCKGYFKSRVTVYSHVNVEVKTLLELNGLSNEETYEFYPINDDDIVDIEDVSIGFLTYKTSHVEELSSYGLVIHDYENDKFIAYTGDSNKLTDSINTMFELEGKALDYLYVDTCSQHYDGNVHLSLFELKEAVKEQHRHKVWCMHLDEKFDVDYAKSLGFNIAEVESLK